MFLRSVIWIVVLPWILCLLLELRVYHAWPLSASGWAILVSFWRALQTWLQVSADVIIWPLTPAWAFMILFRFTLLVETLQVLLCPAPKMLKNALLSIPLCLVSLSFRLCKRHAVIKWLIQVLTWPTLLIRWRTKPLRILTLSINILSPCLLELLLGLKVRRRTWSLKLVLVCKHINIVFKLRIRINILLLFRITTSLSGLLTNIMSLDFITFLNLKLIQYVCIFSDSKAGFF